MLNDFSYDLMPGRNAWKAHGEIAFDHMQISATDATGANADQDLIRPRHRLRLFDQLQRRLTNRLGMRQDPGTHR
jgi:hypothetical protein